MCVLLEEIYYDGITYSIIDSTNPNTEVTVSSLFDKGAVKEINDKQIYAFYLPNTTHPIFIMDDVGTYIVQENDYEYNDPLEITVIASWNLIDLYCISTHQIFTDYDEKVVLKEIVDEMWVYTAFEGYLNLYLK